MAACAPEAWQPTLDQHALVLGLEMMVLGLEMMVLGLEMMVLG